MYIYIYDPLLFQTLIQFIMRVFFFACMCLYIYLYKSDVYTRCSPPVVFAGPLVQRCTARLQDQCRHFVFSNGSSSARVSLAAGHTGARCNIGQPQRWWKQGIALASAMAGLG